MNFSNIRAAMRGRRSWLIPFVAACLLGISLTGIAHRVGAQTPAVESDLTVHEWGTFTSIAGQDGQALEWHPQSGSNDLPGFVERFYVGLKYGLRGTVRMETPVLYFHSQRPMTLSVQVDFSHGLITEWYPQAHNNALGLNPNTLFQKHADGQIRWNSVTLEPGAAPEFPRDLTDPANHYYAARETSATPLRVPVVGDEQREKFLFYRGVATFPIPVSATLSRHDDLKVQIPGPDEIPNLILFERRGDRIGYRILNGPQQESILQPPKLGASLEPLYSDLEQILESQGLYQDEAHAMLQTWRNSWFEEGSRLFYIVPPSFVDSVLPLRITPAPGKTVRVFVGRLELITPATEKAVAEAQAHHDETVLAKYGRFLEPILQLLNAKKQRF